MSEDALRNYQRLLSTIRSDSEVGATVGALLKYLLLRAVDTGATDIILNSPRDARKDGYSTASLRVGGALTQVTGLDGEPLVIPHEVGVAVKGRVAHVARLGIDEEQSVPNNGRLEIQIPNGPLVDLRFESVPLRDGISITILRLLDPSSPSQERVSAD